MTPGQKLALVLGECRLTDGRPVGKAMKDDPWVIESLLEPVFAETEDGRPRYRLPYIELPRGHWKSGGVAAIAVAEALEPGTDVVVAAADSDQARIVTENVDAFCSRNPELGALFSRRRDERYTEHGSRIRAISSDAATAFGLGGTHRRFRVICDELTIWPNDALWVALVSATGKVQDAQTIVLSNAGFEAERSWQWGVRSTARDAEFGYLFAADGVIASWVTPEWVAEMRELLPGAAFDRLLGNRWTSGAGDFVTDEQWTRCIDEQLEARATGTSSRHYAGLDLGLTRDRTALAVTHRDGEHVVLDDLAVWQGTKAEPVSILSIERALVDTSDRFRGLRVSADPWQMKGSLERLRGHLHITEFVFSSSSVQKLSATLHHAITSARLRVYPDAELDREILGLRVVDTAAGWRFDHRAGGFSDRAVAIAMATLAAQTQTSGQMTSILPRGRLDERSPEALEQALRPRRKPPVRIDRSRQPELAGFTLYDPRSRT